VNKIFTDLKDITLNGTEKSLSKYVNGVWECISFEDYVSLLQKKPNENIQNHEIFKDYKDKIKLTKKLEAEREEEFFKKILKIEQEKIFYFVLTYPQKLVLVKSGEKKTEKDFLGYEFSARK
jgi:type I restriction enzyme M protein